MFKKLMGVAAAAALAAVAIAAPAGATDLVVTAGTLDFDPAGAPTIGDFSGVTLNGNPQLTSLQIDPFTIIDSSGTAAGWHVLLSMPDLDDGASHTISSDNVSMTAATVRAAAGSSLVGVTANAIPQTNALNGAGEKIVVATATNGEGTYLISPAILKLTVPADTFAATYSSTAVIAVNSGP
jgi:hypothetical protein